MRKQIDKVIVAITHGIRPEVYARLVETKMRGVVIYDMASFYEKVLGKIPVTHVSDLWLVYTPISGVKRNIYNYKVKTDLRYLPVPGRTVADPANSCIYCTGH